MSVLITGATSGIGLALAQDYAKERKVIACGRSAEKLEHYYSNLNNVSKLCFDICSKSQVLASADELGELELIILNAGDCEYMDEVVPFDSEKFERIIKINVVGLGYCLDAFLPKLKSGGQLVIISSSAVIVPFPRAQAYGASKAAVSYLARSLAVDLVAKKIDVTLVEPGFVKTPLTEKNDFDMPFLVPVDKAAKIIAKGISDRKAEVRFPTSLMLMLHLLAQLPAKILAKLLVRK